MVFGKRSLSKKRSPEGVGIAKSDNAPCCGGYDEEDVRVAMIATCTSRRDGHVPAAVG